MDRGTQNMPLLIENPGHGGNKPGAVDPLYGIKEKHVTLKVALYLKEWAQNRGFFHPYLTRNDYQTISLDQYLWAFVKKGKGFGIFYFPFLNGFKVILRLLIPKRVVYFGINPAKLKNQRDKIF